MHSIPEIAKTFEELSKMVSALHVEESVGGPLHIITDDGNLKDSHIVYCYRNLEPEPRNTLVGTLCASILHLLTQLTEPQRTLWWLHKGHHNCGPTFAPIAALCRDGIVKLGPNGLYDCRIVNSTGSKTLWENPKYP